VPILGGGYMIGEVYEFEDLQKITGYKREADIKSSLRKQGVLCFTGKGGRPYTTKGLIEAAGGLGKIKSQDLQNLTAGDIL